LDLDLTHEFLPTILCAEADPERLFSTRHAQALGSHRENQEKMAKF